MKVRVLYFARVREEAGLDSEEVEMADGATVQDLLDALAVRHRIVRIMLPSLRTGVNDRYAGRGTTLHDGDEIALLSPVSGG
ncbi:MAG: MoaD/ThiS family protein [Rhodothermales bacterium]